MYGEKNYTPELYKEIDDTVQRFQKLLKLADGNEFVGILRFNNWFAGRDIEIKDDWYRATSEYINHNVVVEPYYYFDLDKLYSTEEIWEKEFGEPDNHEYIYTDWREDETIGSGMLTLTSEQFQKFEYGKLAKMFIRFMKDKYKDLPDNKDWWVENHERFLADDKEIIHVIISVHDQCTTASLRHFVYDDVKGTHVSEAFRYLTERVSIADVLGLSY
jgi:hypothetical protein